MTRTDARYIADIVTAKLMPVTERLQICGSYRREKYDVHDIDIVVIPKREPVKDLFGMVSHHKVLDEFVSRVNAWPKVKGEPTGKYVVRQVDGINVEISICDIDNFGIMQLIRTGDSDFTHMMMNRVLACGLKQRDGYLWRENGSRIPIYNEINYFNVLDLPYVEPKDRTKDAFKNKQHAKNDSLHGLGVR